MSEMPDFATPSSNVDFSNVDFGNLDTSFLTVPDAGQFTFPSPPTNGPDFMSALMNITRDITGTIRGGQQAKTAQTIATHTVPQQGLSSNVVLFGGLGLAALLLLSGKK